MELAPGTQTSAATMAAAKAFVEAIRLTPLMVAKQSTGFLFNRIWRAIKKECLLVAGDGVAAIEDIDRAWMIFTKMSIGPFGQMDLIGLDVVRDIEMVYYRKSGEASDAPNQMLLNKIERGELGVKTGKGFYTYPNPSFEMPGFVTGGAK